MTARAGLGALTELEVERSDVSDLVEAPTEHPAGEFVEVTRILGLFLGQHAALSGADASSG